MCINTEITTLLPTIQLFYIISNMVDNDNHKARIWYKNTEKSKKNMLIS